MRKRWPDITDKEHLDFTKIRIWHRGKPYGLRVEIGPGNLEDRKRRTCQHCGGKQRGGLIGRRTIDCVWHLIENADGHPRLQADNHFGKIIINKARKQASVWLCRRDDCELTRFETD